MKPSIESTTQLEQDGRELCQPAIAGFIFSPYGFRSLVQFDLSASASLKHST